jgi:hypothetical protein
VIATPAAFAGQEPKHAASALGRAMVGDRWRLKRS